MYNSQLLAERIEMKLKEKKSSVKKMLEELCVAKNTVGNLKKGEDKDIALPSLVKIAEYLDCSIDYLIGRTDNANAHKDNYEELYVLKKTGRGEVSPETLIKIADLKSDIANNGTSDIP